MNEVDFEEETHSPSINAQELRFANWSEDPAIRHLVLKVAQAPDLDGVEALVLSAFEAGWSGGFNFANE